MNHPTRETINTDWSAQRVGDIVTRLPQAATLFRAAGVDYCCGGHRPLGEALAAEGRDPRELDSALDAVRDRAASEREYPAAFEDMEVSDLTAHIETRHHRYLRDALPRTAELARRVLTAHGQRHPELFRIHALYGRLQLDLEQHLIKEEVSLFPQLAAAPSERSADTVQLAAEIREEHEAAGRTLHELRALTGGYTMPDDGCASYGAFMEALSALEADLFQHIHLENNILLRDPEAAA